MPPKKKIISLDQFHDEPTPKPKNNNGGGNKNNHNNNNNKGFLTTAEVNDNNKRQYNNNNHNNNGGGHHNNSNNNHHGGNRGGNNNHYGGGGGGGGDHSVNRKFNNQGSDSNTSLHQPYWPISLVNNYTLPFSIPLPVHWTKQDIDHWFSTNLQLRQNKQNDKNVSKGMNYHTRQVQNQVDKEQNAKENDGEYLIDTHMRNLYTFGLENMIDSKVGVVRAEPTQDLLKQQDAAGRAAHMDPKKVSLPAFSEMLPDVPFKELRYLNDRVYSVIPSDQNDYVDSGANSNIKASTNNEADELAALFDQQFAPPTPQKKQNNSNNDNNNAFADIELAAHGLADLPSEAKVIDFNIPELVSNKRYYGTFGNEYPALLEGEVVIISRERNSYLRLPNCDYDILINAPALNRVFHGDHAVASLLHPYQWRVQRVVPLSPEELLNKTEGANKNNNNNNNNNNKNGGDNHGGEKKQAPRGAEVGKWCAARQVAEIQQFLDSNAVQKLINIEYFRQVDYWYKACRYGVYSMPVQQDDDTNTHTEDVNGLFSPKTPSAAEQAYNTQQIDDEDEYNTTMSVDKTSTLSGYSQHDITQFNMYTNTEHPIDIDNAENAPTPQYTKEKKQQIVEQYLATKKMWQKNKTKRVNALHSEHPMLLQATPSLTDELTEDGRLKRVYKTDPGDQNKFKEALYSWYQTLTYQSAATQALSSDQGMISPLTPPSLTGPMPILNSNPSLWYVNFMMALLHAFFPAFQFQPQCGIVSVRNSYGPKLKMVLPPISKVFGYWLHDTTTTYKQQIAESAEPSKEQLGYLHDNFITKCQYSTTTRTHHITALPPQRDVHGNVIHPDAPQEKKGSGKKGTNPYANPANDQGITWARGYNAQLAATAYNHLVDINIENNIVTTSDDAQNNNNNNGITRALPEEEIGKANNKKSLYPCLPDHIKKVLLGRDRYFCSTFVAMKISSVDYNIWNTALNFPLEALTTHLYNSSFKEMAKKYAFAVNKVISTIRGTVDLTQQGADRHVNEQVKQVRNRISVQVQPQNLRFPAVQLSLSYIIVGDIRDVNVKEYCEKNGIVYDRNSAQSPAYIEFLSNKQKRNTSPTNGNTGAVTYKDPAQDDELYKLLGDDYTYPSQVMLDIKGVDMGVLSRNAPKLYSWFLCTLARLHSIATFIETKYELLQPLIKLKENVLNFDVGGKLGTANAKNKKAQQQQQQQGDAIDTSAPVQVIASPAEENLNKQMGEEIQKTIPEHRVQYLFIQPQDVQLGNIFDENSAHIANGSDSTQQQQQQGMTRDLSQKVFGAAATGADNSKNNDGGNKGGELTPEEHQRLVAQRIMYLSTLNTIQVGPGEIDVEVKKELSYEEQLVPEDHMGEDDFEIRRMDLSQRVVEPTYALTLIESQALSRYIPGLFIIQYNSWGCSQQTPTITIHNENGGSDMISSSDKLLPVLIKNKVTQSDVFSPLIEQELRNTIDKLSQDANNAPSATSPSVQDLAAKGEWRIPYEEQQTRADLRQMLIFSIDPLTAKDLDDTLSVDYIGLSTDFPEGYFPQIKASAGPKALFRMGVHIADVSFFVRGGTLLDNEACNRSTSVYLSTFVIPMLPRILCEELCSLNQGKDRLAFSCFFLMDEDGNVLDIERHVKAKNTIRFNDKVAEVNDTHAITKNNLTAAGQAAQGPVNKNPSKPVYTNDHHKVYTLKDLITPGVPAKAAAGSRAQQAKENVTTMGELQTEFGGYHNDITDEEEDDDYVYDDNMNKDQENNLVKQLEQMSLDPKSKDVKIRKRKQRKHADSDDESDDGEDQGSDDENNTITTAGGGAKGPQRDAKETITPDEAWHKYVTEASWYGKSIIRSALKLDYGAAMMLVECAFQDPMYKQMEEEREATIAAACDPTNDELALTDEKTKLCRLLKTRSISQPLECAQWNALSPMDVVAKVGLHSDEAIYRQIAAHHELNQLFLTPGGRCNPPNYCGEFWDIGIYEKMDQDPTFMQLSDTGYRLIPDIARACRLLHGLGMKRRQYRLTALGSLTLTRNKLYFKHGYQLDHYFAADPAENVNNLKLDLKEIDDYKAQTGSQSVPLPGEAGRSVQHYTLYPLHDTNRMIEEYMLLGNEFVAQRIYRILPKHALLRKHPEPDNNKLVLTTQFLNKLGIPLNTKSAGILQQSLVSLQKLYETTVEKKFQNPAFDIKHALLHNELNKFEEICYRLYCAGCDARTIAEEMFCQTMIAAQYFPTGFQKLDKEQLLEVSKAFGVTDDKKKAGAQSKFGSKGKASAQKNKKGGNAADGKKGGNAADGKKGGSQQNLKNNYQFKWGLECEWIKQFKHYALNMGFYTHFTSPIRRYPDIVVHRVLECSLAIEPACNTLPFSPYYKKNVDTTLDTIITEMQTAPTVSQDPADEVLLKEYAPSNDAAKRVENDNSVFDLVKLVTPPDAGVGIGNNNNNNNHHTNALTLSTGGDYRLKIKGISNSLSNAQHYIKTTTAQLLSTQCERFNEQKRDAKYAGDESNDLMLSELILKRQYQLQWLMEFYRQNREQFEYENEAEVTTEQLQEFFDSKQTSAVQNTPLNCIPTTPDSIGIAFAQQFFAVEQPLIPDGYDLWGQLDHMFTAAQELELTKKYKTLVKYYIHDLFITINKQCELNMNAFLTLLTNKCIAEGKSPNGTQNPLITRQYIINFFFRSPMLVERGILIGCTNRSKPGEVAIFLPRTQQTVQILTDTADQHKILPSLVQNEPLVNGANHNIGCTVIQGSYVLSKQSISSKLGAERINTGKDNFQQLLQDALIQPATAPALAGGEDDHEMDYDEYDQEFLDQEAEDQELLAKAGMSGGKTKPNKIGTKKIRNAAGDEEDEQKKVKNSGIHTNSGKRANQYAEAISAMDIDSMWLINWDPMFASLAWFKWAPIVDMSKRTVPHNSLTLEDCALCLPHYIDNGVWDNFLTQNKDKIAFFPFDKAQQQQQADGPQGPQPTNQLGFANEQEVLLPQEELALADNTNTKISSVTSFPPYCEGVRLFDVVRVVLLPMLPELTFKPMLIPNCVVPFAKD